MKGHIAAWLVALGLPVLVASGTARAQSPLSAEVNWSAAHVSGGDYGDRTRTGVGARVDLRLLSVGATQLLAGISTDRFTGFEPVVIAPIACSPPGNDCGYTPAKAGAPNFTYNALHLGLRRAFGPLVDLGFGAGIDRVRVSRNGSGSRSAASAGADAGLQLAGAIRLLVRVEIISWTEAGNTLDAYPVSFGLRIQ